jgi:hypothetical protein
MWAIAWACRATAFLSPAISLRIEELTGSLAQNEAPPAEGAVVVVVVGMVVEGGVVPGGVVGAGLVGGVVAWPATGWVVAGVLVGVVPLGGLVVVDEPGEEAGDTAPDWDIGDVVEGDGDDPVPGDGDAGDAVAAWAGAAAWVSEPFGWTANHMSSTPSPVALTRVRSLALK